MVVIELILYNKYTAYDISYYLIILNYPQVKIKKIYTVDIQQTDTL